MANQTKVIPFPLAAVDDSELRTRYWELVYEGRRDTDDGRALQAEITRRDRREGLAPRGR
jgi:hypothetical protein